MFLEVFTTTYLVAAALALVLRILICRRHPPRVNWVETLRQGLVSFVLVVSAAPLAAYLHIDPALAVPIACFLALIGPENFLLFLLRVLYLIAPEKFKDVINDEIKKQEIRNLESQKRNDQSKSEQREIDEQIKEKEEEMSENQDNDKKD